MSEEKKKLLEEISEMIKEANEKQLYIMYGTAMGVMASSA